MKNAQELLNKMKQDRKTKQDKDGTFAFLQAAIEDPYFNFLFQLDEELIKDLKLTNTHLRTLYKELYRHAENFLPSKLKEQEPTSKLKEQEPIFENTDALKLQLHILLKQSLLLEDAEQSVFVSKEEIKTILEKLPKDDLIKFAANFASVRVVLRENLNMLKNKDFTDRQIKQICRDSLTMPFEAARDYCEVLQSKTASNLNQGEALNLAAAFIKNIKSQASNLAIKAYGLNQDYFGPNNISDGLARIAKADKNAFKLLLSDKATCVRLQSYFPFILADDSFSKSDINKFLQEGRQFDINIDTVFLLQIKGFNLQEIIDITINDQTDSDQLYAFIEESSPDILQVLFKKENCDKMLDLGFDFDDLQAAVQDNIFITETDKNQILNIANKTEATISPSVPAKPLTHMYNNKENKDNFATNQPSRDRSNSQVAKEKQRTTMRPTRGN